MNTCPPIGAAIGLEADQDAGHPDLGIRRAEKPSGERASWSRQCGPGNDIVALPRHPAPPLPG
jgi:hypothetical protein